MEAFSLLKYWRGGASNASANTRSSPTSGCTTTTIVSAATTHLEVDTDNDDDGPFFDLQFTVPDEDETEANEDSDEDEEESEGSNDDVDTKSNGGYSDGEKEFNFTVPIEPNSSLDSKPQQFTVSLLKSAAKVRVFLLRLKKSKLNSTEKTESATANSTVITPKKQESSKESDNSNNKYKFFTVKFKVEEVPIRSLFSKDNSKYNKQQSSDSSVSDVMQRYLKKVKPLYVKASRKYGEKLRFSDQSSLGSLKPATSTVAQESVSGKNLKRVPAGLRVVRKQLGNNRSAFSAVAAAPPAVGLSKRRDDTLLQQEDGVQSAILHCKRSFNGSRDSSVSSMSSTSGE